VHAIDVVAADNVLNHAEHVRAGRRLTRIEPKLAPDAADPFRMTFRDMICGQHRVHVRGGTKRIDPGVQFDPARMRFLDRELQRIVTGRAALAAGEKLRPRLLLGGIERVTRRANLEENSV
jgi:hypothetical protein